MDRGKIIHRERAKQINDFSGLRFDNITPTDIDGIIEYKGKKYIIIELKLVGAEELPFGQKLALERMCDDFVSAGKEAVVLVGVHDTKPEEDVDVASCDVVLVRRNKKWRPPKMKINIRQAIERFIE